MKPEEEARQKIDELLVAAGWVVQDVRQLNLGAGLGVAVREFPLESGFADYVVFVDRKAVGVIEAKKAGTPLSTVEEQSSKYTGGLPPDIPHVELPLPFAYESTGIETHFTDNRDPSPRARRVFAFHTPETLRELSQESDTLRSRLRRLPPLITGRLWGPQVEAIQNLEESLSDNRPRSLIQMTMGSGKTFVACTFTYRLIKFAKAQRVLFLVDRNNLGKQALKEFQQFVSPDDGRKFTELYNVQRLNTNAIDPVCKVTISTIQRLFSMLKGEEELDPSLEERSGFEEFLPDDQVMPVEYNPKIPIETFDFIVTDECHRSIYNLWRQVLEYFDAFIIGLTATPSKQTLGFFNQNLVMEYPLERAVADGIACDYEVYRIKTEITDKGSRVEAGYYVDKRDKSTRKVRWEQLDEDFEYEARQLDRDVVARDQIRTIIRTFRDRLFTEIFPGRTEVPKTLIFAKDDSHAEDIVEIVREEFGKGNEFCKKITYRSEEDTDNLLASFRNSYNPRIAVSVDMISTGVDVKPLECLLFMRDVKSVSYFEQMKGRGTRIIVPSDLQAVTPDATRKTHFVIVDAIGVCESDKTESKPLERNKTVPFEKLLQQVAMGKRDEDTISSLAGRLARLAKVLDEKDGEKVREVSRGNDLSQMTNGLLDAIDPDVQIEKAKEKFATDEPTQRQVEEVSKDLLHNGCEPFDNPNLRNLLIDLHRKSEQTIDTVSQDALLFTGFDERAAEKAKNIVRSFKEFIEEHKDELTALQILYSRPYRERHLTFEAVRELADVLSQPPTNLPPELVWNAYEHLDRGKVKRLGPERLLTDIISLVRYALGQMAILEPFSDLVDERFKRWLERQRVAGREFTDEQIEWLTDIKNHIATSLAIEMDDFDDVPFNQKGGRMKVYQLFGDDLEPVLAELNEVLVA